MSDALDCLKSALAERYTIEHELGAGGMATVYLAHDLKHDRDVALKVLKPELAATLGAERFLLEIRVAAKLNHPHILPLLDSGSAELPVTALPPYRPTAFLFYSMPIVEGESLRAMLNREGQLGVDAVCGLAKDIGAALDYAHNQGVIHRDIKPENILFHHGEPMVADFGIALAVKEAGEERLTETGISVGTPQYMSPEQVSGDRQLDSRTDVYALGCVLYEALVGEPPFTGPSAMAVMARQVTDPVRPIATVRPDVPAHLVSAVNRALAKVPADRFDSAGHLAVALAKPEPIPVQEGADPVPKQEAAPRRTIAVLPFANLSTDPENEYFSDGITDDVMSQLSKVGELKVISRTSTTRFRDTELSLREIGEQLNADVILEGTVRKAGSRVRIVAQLIDARDDTHVWNDTYDRMLTDVFEIQSEVAISIAEALEAELSPKERREIEKKPTEDPEAYNLCLLGRHYCNKRTADDLYKAITYFEQAIERDARYAEAYAGLAEVYLFAGIGYAPIPPAEALDKAKQMALRAIELNPERPEAHSILGFAILCCDWDIAKAEQTVEQALEIDSNHAQAHQWLAWCRAMRGDYTGAAEAWDRALDLDPLSAVLLAESGWPYGYAGLHELALERYQKALSVEPDFAMAYHDVGWAHQGMGRFEEAIEAHQKSVVLSGGAPFMKAFLAAAFAEYGRVEDAEQQLSELQDRAQHVCGMGLAVAIAAEALGKKDLALDTLERAFRDREPFVVALRVTGWLPLASLHGHPRFEALLERGGAPPHDIEGERARLLERERLNSEEAFPGQAVSSAHAGAPQLTPSPETATPAPEISIVVRPFANTSPDPDTEYFADGLTEEIIADLSKVQALFVISRGSAMRLKGSDKDARSIGRELGVRYVLEGSVRKSADDLRITAQLIEAETDRTLWAEKYSGTIKQVFEIQENVSRAIVDALKVTLSPEEDSKLALRPIDDVRAHEAYLRARHEAWSFSEDALKKAHRHIENAVAIVGENEELYATLGHIYASYLQAGVGDAAELIAKAKECAEQVLGLNPNSVRGYWLRGYVRFIGGDVRGSVSDLERAVELDPHDPDALLMLGYQRTMVGKMREADALFDHMLEVDPLTPINHAMPGFVAVVEGRVRDAERRYAKLYQMDPEPPFYRWCYAWALLWNRRVEEAAAIVGPLAAEYPGDLFSVVAEVFLLGVRGERERAAATVTDSLRATGRINELFSRSLVECCALAGRIDEAIEWLENTLRIGNVNYPYWAKHNWFVDNLRGHPRFEQLLDDMEKEWSEITGEQVGSVQRRVGRTAGRDLKAAGSPAERVAPVLVAEDVKNSIAVLPFTNMSADAENEYFSDGITEDIITQLSKISAFKVISRSSSMRYKQSDKTMREIARELGVETLLEGSVRRAGNNLRITAQLIDAESDAHLWADTYDREMTDVFAIQTDVALSVASALHTALTPGEQARIEAQPTDNMKAYDLCLLGRHHASRLTAEGLTQAIGYFEKALDQDPSYAAAYAGLADVHALSAIGYRPVEPREELAKAKDAAFKAIELDETLAEAHAPLGHIYAWFEFKWDDARREFERAVELNPSSVQAHQYYGQSFLPLRDYESAYVHMKRALELDPLSVVLTTELCWPPMYAGDQEKAREQVLKALAMDPSFPLAHFNLAQTYHFEGRYPEAIPIYEKAVELSGGVWFIKSYLAHAYVASGQREKAEAIEAQFLDESEHGMGLELAIAMVHDALGRSEKAMEWLEKAYEARSPMLGAVGLDVLPFHSVRGEPRFHALLEKMGLGELRRND